MPASPREPRQCAVPRYRAVRVLVDLDGECVREELAAPVVFVCAVVCRPFRPETSEYFVRAWVECGVGVEVVVAEAILP